MTVPDSHIFQQQFYWGQTRAQPHGYRPQTWLKFKHNPELGTPELGTPEIDTALQFQK